MRRNWIIVPLISGILLGCNGGKKNVLLEPFSAGRIKAWQEEVFRSPTRYSIVDDDGRYCLQAVSEASASALYLKAEVDLRKTPFLNWSWKIANTLGPLDSSSKAGDDYAARMYVVISPAPFKLKPRSLNYVWANTDTLDAHWQSPYSDDVIMLALQSGDAEAGQWMQEKRNVREDLRRLFGEEADYIEAIALMTDSDDSNGRTTAWYGDVYFSAE